MNTKKVRPNRPNVQVFGMHALLEPSSNSRGGQMKEARLGSTASTPVVEKMIQVLGGSYHHFNGVAFSKDQMRYLFRYYGVTEEKRQESVEQARARHNTYPTVEFFDVAGVAALLEAGDTHNVFRHTQKDGLRAMAFLSKYLSQGEDPVALLVKMANDAGYDVVPEELAWAEGQMEEDADGGP